MSQALVAYDAATNTNYTPLQCLIAALVAYIYIFMIAASFQVSWELLLQHVTTNSHTFLAGQHTASPTWSGQHANCTVFNPAGFPKPLPAQPAAQHLPPALPARNPSLAFAVAFVSKPRPAWAAASPSADSSAAAEDVEHQVWRSAFQKTQPCYQTQRDFKFVIPHPSHGAPVNQPPSSWTRTCTLLCTVVTYLERLHISPNSLALRKIFNK